MRRARRNQPFTVQYVARSKDPDDPDQVLTITNNTEVSVQPTLAYAARDIWGRELPGVTTVGVNGTHRGMPLLPAGGTLTEYLRFDGAGHRDVRLVDVQLAAVEEVDHPPLEQDVRVVMVDLDQKAVLDPADFWGIGIANPNPFGVTVRVSLVAFEDQERDYPRQAVDVVTLQEDVDVASQSHDVIWLPEDVRGRFELVAHHLRPQSLI